ncbi:caveolin-3-like [Littorina saxatilis]|uniref:Caveolin n=1 Tax=Littorina saxatilis TaxID=31220 RepID=A0AAN9B9K6_9CAEN
MASMAASDSGNINLNVGGEAVKGPDPSETTIDIIDRDPANMNAHLKVSFEEIFAEPHPTIFSFDGVWTTSYTVFRNTKIWCYRISTLLCAVPAAFVWGIYFALLACCSIWCCRPCTRAFEMELQCFKGFYAAIIGTFVRPCYEAMGFLFYNFRIFLHNGGGPKDNSACS